jgi:hypothetical protein
MATTAYTPQNGGTPRAGKFKPSALAEILAIAEMPGEISTSEYGPPEVRFRLTDGRPWYVAQAVANDIHARLVPLQQFEVVRIGRGPADLRITPLPANLGYQAPAPYHEPPQHAPQPVAAPAANASPNTARMMACFLVALDAVNEAQSYAKAKGIGITFTSDNVTSAALSCYINECKGGR